MTQFKLSFDGHGINDKNDPKISLIYWIASKMHRDMNYGLAQRIAERFSDTELTRIYLSL